MPSLHILSLSRVSCSWSWSTSQVYISGSAKKSKSMVSMVITSSRNRSENGPNLNDVRIMAFLYCWWDTLSASANPWRCACRYNTHKSVCWHAYYVDVKSNGTPTAPSVNGMRAGVGSASEDGTAISDSAVVTKELRELWDTVTCKLSEPCSSLIRW